MPARWRFSPPAKRRVSSRVTAIRRDRQWSRSGFGASGEGAGRGPSREARRASERARERRQGPFPSGSRLPFVPDWASLCGPRDRGAGSFLSSQNASGLCYNVASYNLFFSILHFESTLYLFLLFFPRGLGDVTLAKQASEQASKRKRQEKRTSIPISSSSSSASHSPTAPSLTSLHHRHRCSSSSGSPWPSSPPRPASLPRARSPSPRPRGPRRRSPRPGPGGSAP